MTRRSDEPRILAAMGHLLRGAAVGAVAFGVVRVGWHALASEPAPLTWREAAVSLMLVPAILLMLRAVVFPQEKPGARVLVLESSALLALIVPFGFVLAAIQPVVPGPEKAAIHPTATGLMLTMLPAAWAVVWSVRRRAWRAGSMPVRDGVAETWRDEMNRLAASRHGGFPIAMFWLMSGLLLANFVAGLAIPAGWCGGMPKEATIAALIGLIAAISGQPDPVLRRGAWALVLLGFGGTLAAVLAAWLLTGCAGAAEWLGWEPDTVEFVIGGIVSSLVVVTYYLRAARKATGDESGKDSGKTNRT